jgi:hypothetical protein
MTQQFGSLAAYRAFRSQLCTKESQDWRTSFQLALHNQRYTKCCRSTRAKRYKFLFYNLDASRLTLGTKACFVCTNGTAPALTLCAHNLLVLETLVAELLATALTLLFDNTFVTALGAAVVTAARACVPALCTIRNTTLFALALVPALSTVCRATLCAFLLYGSRACTSSHLQPFIRFSGIIRKAT